MRLQERPARLYSPQTYGQKQNKHIPLKLTSCTGVISITRTSRSFRTVAEMAVKGFRTQLISSPGENMDSCQNSSATNSQINASILKKTG